MVTASDDGTARLWDTESGTLIAVLNGHTDRLWSAVISPDAKRVVTSSDDGRHGSGTLPGGQRCVARCSGNVHASKSWSARRRSSH